MILALGARGPEFDSRNAPVDFFNSVHSECSKVYVLLIILSMEPYNKRSCSTKRMTSPCIFTISQLQSLCDILILEDLKDIWLFTEVLGLSSGN